MKTIIVTGGAGFIGSNLIAELLRQNYRVICVDNFDNTYNPKFKEENIAPFLKNGNFILHRTDICDFMALQTIFKKEKPTLVAHLASKADTRDAVKNPEIYISVNIGGTLNLLNLARDYGVKRIVMASSGSVYGNNPNIPWKEEENTDFPLSAYGATKKTTEMLAYTYHHNFNMNVICLRYFNVYGQNNRPNMLPYKWADAFLNKKELELSGKGTRKRDFTHVSDVVSATILALKSSLKFSVLNIANSKPVSLKELLVVFEKITGVKPNVRSRPSHKASATEMWADNSRAKELLKWEPKITIWEGIANLVSWYRQNRL